MKIELLPVDELSPEDRRSWVQIQEADPRFCSPYFRPEYVEIVASVRRDVEVAVMRDEGRAVGFFPFQRSRLGVGKPVGGHLCAYHGAIVPQHVRWNAEELIRACRLRAFDFDHLLASQVPFARHHHVRDISPVMDLSGGFDQYQQRVRRRSNRLKALRRSKRRLEKEMGPVRLVADSRDLAVIETLIAWKTDQFRQTKVPDVLASDWTREILRRVLRREDDALRGRLGLLFVGDELAAIDFDIRSHGVLHGWFPAYDPRFANYSPGMILLLETAKAAESMGVTSIDLGKGQQQYKLSLMTDQVALAEGSVACRPLTKASRAIWKNIRCTVRASPFRSVAKQAARHAFRLQSWCSQG